MFKHEDERRTLYEFPCDKFKVVKVVVAKEDCVVGNHHHNKKDERFVLISGMALATIGEDAMPWREAPQHYEVLRGTHHKFFLAKGSILLGLASEEYDPEDEIKS